MDLNDSCEVGVPPPLDLTECLILLQLLFVEAAGSVDDDDLGKDPLDVVLASRILVATVSVFAAAFFATRSGEGFTSTTGEEMRGAGVPGALIDMRGGGGVKTSSSTQSMSEMSLLVQDLC